MRLYDLDVSGNCYKVRLLLSLLDLSYEPVEVDFVGGEHKQPAMLALNPFGEVPVLVRIPAHRDRPFRSNVTARSGLT